MDTIYLTAFVFQNQFKTRNLKEGVSYLSLTAVLKQQSGWGSTDYINTVFYQHTHFLYEYFDRLYASLGFCTFFHWIVLEKSTLPKNSIKVE